MARTIKELDSIKGHWTSNAQVAYGELAQALNDLDDMQTVLGDLNSTLEDLKRKLETTHRALRASIKAVGPRPG